MKKLESCICVNITKSYDKRKMHAGVEDNEWLMSCVRYTWRTSIARARQVGYICGLVNGRIVACYRVKSVHPTTLQDYYNESKFRDLDAVHSFKPNGRCVFEIEPENLTSRLQDKYLDISGQNPVRYCAISFGDDE